MKDEQRCMYLPAAWFVDKQHDIFFEAQYLLGRIPYLRKKRKKKGKKKEKKKNRTYKSLCFDTCDFVCIH